MRVRMRRVAVGLLGVVVLLMPLGCSASGSGSPSGAPTPTASGAGFEIHILKYNYQELDLQNSSAEDAWAILSKVDLHESVTTVASADIVTYDWAKQAITLTPEASSRLSDIAAPYGLPLGLNQKCFVVTLDGRGLYGGVLLHPASELGVYFPVMYVEASSATTVLRVLPWTLCEDFSECRPDEQSRIARPEVREFFSGIGKLTD